MEYEDFKKMYLDDLMVFYLGLELFGENGRDKIMQSTDEELNAAAGIKLNSLFTEKKIKGIAEAAKRFSEMKSVELLAYASRCGIQLEDKPMDEPEVCPLCGGSLHYGAYEITDELRTQDWTCEECGATGKEAYRMIFDCHFHVRDPKGKLADRWNQNQ